MQREHAPLLVVRCPSMRRLPALTLLAVLLGGLGASSVHRVQHAVEWAEAQRSHAADHHEDGSDRATTPCTGGDLHALDCAVCAGLSAAVVERVAHVGVLGGVVHERGATEAHAVFRRAATPARGPPAVA